MGLSSQDLEDLADHLLMALFKDKRKNKSQMEEFPVLSPSQLKRRCSSEIPYSNLSIRQKLNARMKDYEYEGEDDL